MTDKPDLEDLARRYMDLWQEHLAGLAEDREVADIVARTVEMMNAGPAAMAAMGGAAGPQGEPGDDDDGAAAAGAAHGAADPRVPELERRIAELERRLAALEGSAGPGPGGGTGGG